MKIIYLSCSLCRVQVTVETRLVKIFCDSQCVKHVSSDPSIILKEARKQLYKKQKRLRLTHNLKVYIHETIDQYCNILNIPIPKIAINPEEFEHIRERYSDHHIRLVARRKALGVAYNMSKYGFCTVRLFPQKHKSIKQLEDTIVHELVHCKSYDEVRRGKSKKELQHGKKFDSTVKKLIKYNKSNPLFRLRTLRDLD